MHSVNRNSHANRRSDSIDVYGRAAIRVSHMRHTARHEAVDVARRLNIFAVRDSLSSRGTELEAGLTGKSVKFAVALNRGIK